MDTSTWPNDIDLEDIIPTIILGAAQATRAEKTPWSTGLLGREYLHELLQSSPKRIYNVLRIQKETIFELCEWLESKGKLELSHNISIQEQVAMFLWTINYSVSNR